MDEYCLVLGLNTRFELAQTMSRALSRSHRLMVLILIAEPRTSLSDRSKLALKGEFVVDSLLHEGSHVPCRGLDDTAYEENLIFLEHLIVKFLSDTIPPVLVVGFEVFDEFL